MSVPLRSALAALTVAALGTLSACGAVNWDREPPYQLVHAWGERGSGAGQFNEPTGIAVGEDEVYVSDARNRRVQVFDRHGRFRREFGQSLQRPMNLDFHGGRLYVADFFTDRILVYEPGGKLLEAIAPVDGLHNPGGVAVRADGSILIADTYAHRVLLVSSEGNVLRSWGTSSETGVGAGEFNYPTDVASAPDGGFYVADGYNDRVQQFDSNGGFVRKWGGPFGMNIHGPFKGWFATVTSIAVGPDGSVLAADFYNDRVQKFNSKGVYLKSFGEYFEGATHTAIAVDVDSDGTTYVADYARHQVQVWRPAR